MKRTATSAGSRWNASSRSSTGTSEGAACHHVPASSARTAWSTTRCRCSSCCASASIGRALSPVCPPSGATFAAQAAVRRPELVTVLTATGMDIDIPFAENHTYDFVLRTARRQGNRHAIRQLEALGPPPPVEAKQFATRPRWATNFGGVTVNTVTREVLCSLRRSPDYSVADAVRTVHAVRASQVALLPQLAT